MIMIQLIIFGLSLFVYFTLLLHFVSIDAFNYFLLIAYAVIVIYLVIINQYTNKIYFTSHVINQIINQNTIFSVLSIFMTIHLIFLKYKNKYYQKIM